MVYSTILWLLATLRESGLKTASQLSVSCCLSFSLLVMNRPGGLSNRLFWMPFHFTKISGNQFHENFFAKSSKKWKIGKIWIKSLVPTRNQTFSAVRFITKFSTFRWKQLFPLYHQSKIRKININIMNTIWRTLTIPIIYPFSKIPLNL